MYIYSLLSCVILFLLPLLMWCAINRFNTVDHLKYHFSTCWGFVQIVTYLVYTHAGPLRVKNVMLVTSVKGYPGIHDGSRDRLIYLSDCDRPFLEVAQQVAYPRFCIVTSSRLLYQKPLLWNAWLMQGSLSTCMTYLFPPISLLENIFSHNKHIPVN